MAARKLGMDPLELRLKNCVGPGDITVRPGDQSCNLAQCLNRRCGRGVGSEKPGRGYGISGAIHANGSVVAHKDFRGAAAVVRLRKTARLPSLRASRITADAHAVFAQIAARVLNISPRDITVYSKDTAVTPIPRGAFAMRQTTIGGHAVRLAAEDLKAEDGWPGRRAAGSRGRAVRRGFSGRLTARSCPWLKSPTSGAAATTAWP